MTQHSKNTKKNLFDFCYDWITGSESIGMCVILFILMREIDKFWLFVKRLDKSYNWCICCQLRSIIGMSATYFNPWNHSLSLSKLYRLRVFKVDIGCVCFDFVLMYFKTKCPFGGGQNWKLVIPGVFNKYVLFKSFKMSLQLLKWSKWYTYK